MLQIRVILLLCVPFFTVARVDAGLVNIVASGNGANVETISQIVLNVTTTSGTSLVTQNAPNTTSSNQASSAVLQSISTSAGKLVDFSPLVPTVTSNSFPATAGNIEVFTPTTAVNVADAAFLTELANMHSTGDLLQYLRVDSTTVEPVWTIEYGAAFGAKDYLIIEERNGNTTFEVEALDAAGNVIMDSDTLAFNNQSYQWDTGLVNALDPFANQTQVASVVSFSRFFTNSTTTADIYGFRITNSGRADFKFFIGSTAPEPSSLILFGLSAVPAIAVRRRRRRTLKAV